MDKCKDCKWLDLEQKKSVGYRCTCPTIERKKDIANWMALTKPACKKGFEHR